MALVVSYVNGANWTGATSTPSLSAISVGAGDLLIAFCMQDAPFAGQTVSSATYGGNALTSAVEVVGSGGAPYDWIVGAAYTYQASVSAAVTLVFNLAGNAARGSIVALKATGFNTTTPVGDTDSSMTVAAVQAITLTGSSGDVALYACTSDQQSADRWLEVNNSATQEYNSDPRPASSGPAKIAVGSKAFSGSSATLGFTSRGVDSGPIDANWEKLAIGLVIQAAAGGGGGSSGFSLLVADDE